MIVCGGTKDRPGNDFRGFHIRFRDVARGGIRLVMSRNKECVFLCVLLLLLLIGPILRVYSINQRMLYVDIICSSSLELTFDGKV